LTGGREKRATKKINKSIEKEKSKCGKGGKGDGDKKGIQLDKEE